MNIQNVLLSMHQTHDLFPPGDRVIVGVSGGADSLALLHALATLRKKLGIELHAATLDHGLRGAAGAEDAAYVERLAGEWRVPVTRGAVSVPTLAETWGLGIEEAARRARYDFLAGVARRQGAETVAVAHHADDQAETVLMALFRGAGLDGLSGMWPESPLPYHPELVLIRPLLDVTGDDIDAYCRARGIAPREDATNAETASTRNWVRHAVLPLAQTRFPGAARAIAELAASTRRDVELLEMMTAALWMQAQVGSEQVTIGRPLFRQSPEAIQRRWVRRAVAHLRPEAELSHERTEAVVALALNGRKGQVIELPAGLRATVENNVVRIRSVSNPES